MNSFEIGNKAQDTNGVPGIEELSFFSTITGGKRVYMDAANKRIVIEEGGQPSSIVGSVVGSTSDFILTGGSGITARLNATETDGLIEAVGGVVAAPGSGRRSISLDTSLCVASGTDGTKARPIAVRAVKSCDASDPPGSAWVRLVACSDRFRIS